MLANLIGAPHFVRCGSTVLNLAAVRAVHLEPDGYPGKVLVQLTGESILLSGPDAEAARVLFNPLCIDRLLADVRARQARTEGK